MHKHEIWQQIAMERERQDRLHPPMDTDLEWLSVLIEEVGEIGKAIQEGTNTEEEIIHAASVCIRWLENR